MIKFDRKKHWEQIYRTNELEKVSWYQPTPVTSLRFIQQLKFDKDAKVIDIGGGDSLLVDHLLDLGYTDITVLDISERALEKTKDRLGKRSELVHWIISDIIEFTPSMNYDIWHDRAAFHFLTDDKEIHHYLATLSNTILPGGYVVIGSFSEDGPAICSGIKIRQYSEESMNRLFNDDFNKIECLKIDHSTPGGKKQNFLFCSFEKN